MEGLFKEIEANLRRVNDELTGRLKLAERLQLDTVARYEKALSVHRDAAGQCAKDLEMVVKEGVNERLLSPLALNRLRNRFTWMSQPSASSETSKPTAKLPAKPDTAVRPK